MVPKVFIDLVIDMEGKATVSELCDLFGVARSTYYRWKKKWKNARLDVVEERSKLEQEIENLCTTNKFRYGYRTIRDLLRQAGRKVNRKTVQRIMQKYGWNCRVKMKKRKKTGQPHYVALNLLERDFVAEWIRRSNRATSSRFIVPPKSLLFVPPKSLLFVPPKSLY